MARPPRSPPLFPYPALFRSGTPAEARGREPVGDQIELRICARVTARRLTGGRVGRLTSDPPPPVEAPREQKHERHEQDRKSTRLNSSHLVISYAVFCLKKKR